MIFSLAFSPDGSTLASGCDDHMVKLWSVAIRHDVATFHEHERLVRAVAFSPDGLILASTGDDGTVRLRRAASLAETDARGPQLKDEGGRMRDESGPSCPLHPSSLIPHPSQPCTG